MWSNSGKIIFTNLSVSLITVQGNLVTLCVLNNHKCLYGNTIVNIGVLTNQN